jgi:cell division transport system permease protein
MRKEKTKMSKHPFANIHFTSTFSMSLVLFLVGLVCLLLFVARDMSRYVKENINLSIILDDQASSPSAKRIEKYLLASPYAKSVEFITKEAALEDHIASLGEDPQKFLGYNPLMASLEVKLNAEYANTDSVEMIESKLKKFEHINRVAYQKDMVTLVNENIKKLSMILLALAAVLMFISVALINNTIRLTVHSNRFLINTMKLVGATRWFIRRPYIGRSMLNGLIAALISILFLVGTVYYIQTEFGLQGMMIQPMTGVLVAIIVVSLGMILTAVSSYFAVGRFLKMSSNDMYFI